MRVEVQLFATLAAFLPSEGRDGIAELEIPEGSTVVDLARRLGIPPDLARVVLVNGHDIGSEAPLAPEDIVTIFPPLAGGSWQVAVGAEQRRAVRARRRSKTPYASRGSEARAARRLSGFRVRSATARSIVESISAPTSSATPLQ